MRKYDKSQVSMRKCAKCWESVPKADKVCQKLRRYEKDAKSWVFMPKAEKEWQNVPKAEKVSKSAQKCVKVESAQQFAFCLVLS